MIATVRLFLHNSRILAAVFDVWDRTCLSSFISFISLQLLFLNSDQIVDRAQVHVERAVKPRIIGGQEPRYSQDIPRHDDPRQSPK
jgi:hypothetical protein